VGDDENYAMSDRDGDSDDDEDEEEAEGRARKPVPDWARGATLESAIHAQYGDGGLDPDRIFAEVNTCDLEEIFRAKKKRYTKRTSSGHWLHDRLTHAERQKYRQDMRYQ
jgi:hypothetical protein